MMIDFLVSHMSQNPSSLHQSVTKKIKPTWNSEDLEDGRPIKIIESEKKLKIELFHIDIYIMDSEIETLDQKMKKDETSSSIRIERE